MSFENNLQQAFAKNNVQTVIEVFATEKLFKSFADRLEKIVIKELDKNLFKNVILILKAIEKAMEQDPDCFHTLVQQGLVVMMLTWYERTMEQIILSEEATPEQMTFLEAFYDIAVKLSHGIIEGKATIRTLLILRFGALVADERANYKLRLDAIQTINSMVDGISKDDRRDICQCSSLSQLLEDFANALLKGGDYEFQVAVTEALSRMTVKRTREDIAHKWFGDKGLASSFIGIKYGEFETDCRIFLNEVNLSFGDERRVFTFPCSRVFLGPTELYKPDDVHLKEFWVDFNVGSSCITFSVDDPENSLWGSICLVKTSVRFYELSTVTDQLLLTIWTTSPVVPYGKLSGQTVYMYFSPCLDIASALQKVFGDIPQPKGSVPERQTAPLASYIEDSSSEPPGAVTEDSPSPQITNEDTEMSQAEVSVQQEEESTPTQDVFLMRNDSDTEVEVKHNLEPTRRLSKRSQVTKPDNVSFWTALKIYKVMRARTRFLSKPASTNVSHPTVSASTTEKKVPQKTRGEGSNWADLEGNSIATDKLSPCHTSTPTCTYTRKKPKVKGRLRVLPLSSPSSGEEDHVKTLSSIQKTSAANLQVISEISECEKGQTDAMADSGFLELSVLDSTIPETLPCDLADKESALAQESSFQSRKRPLKSPEPSVIQRREQAGVGLQSRGLFHSHPQEGAADPVMADEEDSEADIMGPDVISAFRSFKSQLLDHVFAKYQKIETRSLQSLSDCQNQVVTLLKTVQTQRLQLLERFEEVVVEQLGRLEQDCRSLRNIEQETMTFWKTEYQAVRSFCERQQSRLDSLEICRGNTTQHAPAPQAEEEDASME
ncbi:synaptonemal complex protein 2-like isoform X1 [Alosa sapidissima]|uniref:synaptonemal complex protein 2-like isoform X1 n=4 Tax=Alosa sapidissima TaxID=34773 RepID=UPI001C08D758|nr:synaptonemal complex protein 2-like isoform X1 [Alosa sapidissima]